MAVKAAKAAHRGDGGDLRNSQSGWAVGSDIDHAAAWPQDRLVGVRRKNNRSRFEGRIRTYDGCRRIVFGVRDQNGIGGFRDNGLTVVFGPEHLDGLIEMFLELRLASVEEGIL